MLTNRNQLLVNATEQKIISRFPVAVIGLSVGSGIATTLVQSGFFGDMYLSDFDQLSTTNLNRFRGSLSDVGERKLDIVARQIYRINPYANIKSFRRLSKNNINDLMRTSTRPRLIFEEIDDFKMKVLLRLRAQYYRIPIVTLTSLGNRVLVDVERYDIERGTKIYNGLVANSLLQDVLKSKLTESKKRELAVLIVGSKNVPFRALQSVKLIGKKLVGRPQLMSTVAITHGLSVYIARRIALGETFKSGRYVLELKNFFNF